MIARELGCKYIISHFVWNRFIRDHYLYTWQQAEANFWYDYANQAEKEGFVIVAENTQETHPEILKPIFDMVDSDAFKLNFDVPHAHLHSEVPIEDWIMAFGKDLVYMHVNNNYRNYDAHDSILKGSINYDHIFKVLNTVGIDPIITTEIYGKGNLLESLDYLEKKISETPVYCK
jgi:sugar phosphate isomerase/epimerase